MAGADVEDLRAVVRPGRALQHFSLQRIDPDPRLCRFVDRFWKTAWDLPEPFTQAIVGYPAVNLVFQADGSAIVSGVKRVPDQRRLQGSGWALGVLFRPGGFRPLVDTPMSSLVDRVLPARDLFGPAVTVLTHAVMRASVDSERIRLVTAFLLERLPLGPTVGEELSAMVEGAASAASPVTRVSDLARRNFVSVRTLQRRFAEHVGIGPKQVLDRYRVQAAAELARAPVTSWIAAAQQLGYADQAHLTADFSATYGSPPATYARAEASSEPSSFTGRCTAP